MKGNCFIDIDGFYDCHCLYTFFSYQSMKIIGLLKVCFLLGFIGWNLYLMDFSGYSNFHHKNSTWNILESGVKHLTSNEQMMDQKFVYVVHNIKHLWVIMWHIFTNNTTTMLFPTQFSEMPWSNFMKPCRNIICHVKLFC
jgi:hypothetical protein